VDIGQLILIFSRLLSPFGGINLTTMPGYSQAVICETSAIGLLTAFFHALVMALPYF